MAKDEQANQLDLTVVALVALVAIVGLVALVFNTASIAKISIGSQAVSAQDDAVDDSVPFADDSADAAVVGDMVVKSRKSPQG